MDFHVPALESHLKLISEMLWRNPVIKENNHTKNDSSVSAHFLLTLDGRIIAPYNSDAIVNRRKKYQEIASSTDLYLQRIPIAN